jgi:hypothetical protein
VTDAVHAVQDEELVMSVSLDSPAAIAPDRVREVTETPPPSSLRRCSSDVATPLPFTPGGQLLATVMNTPSDFTPTPRSLLLGNTRGGVEGKGLATRDAEQTISAFPGFPSQ